MCRSRSRRRWRTRSFHRCPTSRTPFASCLPGERGGRMTAIKMPQLGETVVEGTILKWLKQEGDEVALDEPLFEISTDKVDTEVPSSAAGTLTKILVAEGETVSVGTEVAEIGEAGAGDGAGGGGATEAAQEPAAATAPTPAPNAGADETPAAAPQQPAVPAAQPERTPEP